MKGRGKLPALGLITALFFIFAAARIAAQTGTTQTGGEDTGGDTSAYYVKASGDDGNDGLSGEAPFRTLAKAVDAARTGAVRHIIVVGTLNEASEVSPGRELPCFLDGTVFYIRDSGAEPLVISGQADARLEGSPDKRVIAVTGESNIRFENIVITGGGTAGAGQGGGVYAFNRVRLTLGPGAEVRDNRAAYGGGLCVEGAFLVLEGGLIADNAAGVQGGGVFVLGDDGIPAKFTITAGQVLDNTASGLAGEAGGGVYVRGGVLLMYGGEIAGNSAGDDNGGGIFIKNGDLKVGGGAIHGNSGGGVYALNSIFKMTGGEIRGNRAEYNGGGVSFYEGRFTMFGGGINGNSAAAGGGVFVYYGSEFRRKGGVISGNTPEDVRREE
jgi:hypothetical protein